jgi:hypothetical protein
MPRLKVAILRMSTLPAFLSNMLLMSLDLSEIIASLFGRVKIMAGQIEGEVVQKA